ncbi:MAG TPA: crossover junction endodeoxyribonuclease RuvC [Ktedonobacterales bacterium]
MSPTLRRAIGIDPGTARLGYAVVELEASRLKLTVCDVITTPPDLPLAERLKCIYDELTALVIQYQPGEMAVEELFFGKNATTGVAVGQARGIALLVSAQHKLMLGEYKPMAVKQAVHGYGHATKQQVGEMVRMLLGLDAVPRPDDAADAAAIAICHLNTFRLSAYEGIRRL